MSMCSGHSISGRSNTTGVYWSEIPGKAGTNLWIESPRTDAGGVRRLCLILTYHYVVWASSAKRQRFAVLYFLRGWYKPQVECHRHSPRGHWVNKVFKVQRLLPSLSFSGFSPRTLVTMAQATKLNYDFHSRPKKATESWRLGWQKDAKSNGNSLAKHFVTLPGVASACAWNILPELLDQIWPEHSWTIEKLQSIYTSAAFEW